ncbi:hypothetical protein [Dactylosporangium matsuzakiense]|uniref:Uncharacterized protein n=1 Tax=Dactylosporangium matsuzakiense TaxID=53360 RepID=A0A9W6KUI1_9ACTN|nr:hypothetical protein [Dactylosporangium matsuzakiense]GLL08356.1 hypothetical protein GCM10017581_101170 [Dactylosporangium matsuzakiense]
MTRYFDEMQYSQRKGCFNPSHGSFVVGSSKLDRSVAISAQTCQGGGANYLEYALDPTFGCTKVSMIVGVPNDQNDNARALMEVDIDGAAVMPGKAFARGASQPIATNIRPSSIIRLVLENTTPRAGFSSVTGVFGNAILTCAL